MVQHTGYSRAHLHTIKAELVTAGYLRLVHRTNEQRGQDSNAYDFSGLLEAIRAHLQPDESLVENANEVQIPDNPRGKQLFSPRRGQVAARQRADARSVKVEDSQANTPYEEEQTRVYEIEQTGGYESQQIAYYESQQTTPNENGHTAPVHPDSYKSANPGRWGPTKPNSHESEPVQEETKNRDDSNPISPKKRLGKQETNATPPPYSQYIAAVLADFSTELADPDHIVSNVTQASRLWQTTGLSEEGFIELLYEAKRRTRTYQGKQGSGAINNKMAYFFVTLRSLCDGNDQS